MAFEVKKILILNYEYPPIGGGGGVVSKYHAEGLAKFGYEVTVLTTWFLGEKEFEEKDNLKIIKIKSRRKYIHKSGPLDWISWMKKTKQYLANYLKKNHFDFCIAHFALPGGEVARYINMKFKLPYIVVSHGQDIPWFFPKQMFKYHILTYFWIKSICKNAERLVLLTEAMKKNADKFMGKYKKKNIIIPNGCNTDFFKQDISKKSKTFKIIFVGRLVAQKDPFTFLKAIKLVRDKIPTFNITIIGDGPLRKKMESYSKTNKLSENVQFIGWVSKEEILKQYQEANLQIITSIDEAMSIAALEAVSTGLYLISTPVSGNTEIIKEEVNGEFIKFKDYEYLSERIFKFYNDKFLKGYYTSIDFVENIRQQYNWNNIIIKIQNSIELLLKETDHV